MAKNKRKQPQTKKGPLPAAKNSSTKLIKNALFILIIVAAGTLLYSKTTGWELVYCDDNIFVHDYYNFNKDIDNFWRSLDRTFGLSYYRPVLMMSFVIDANIGGQDPSTYRLTNILIHILASVFVYVFFRVLRFSELKSLIFSLIFILHPVIVPSAAWISGRNDSLVTLFAIISFICFIRFKEDKSSLAWLYLPFHLFTYWSGLFTKEITAMLPFLAIAYILLVRKEKKVINTKNIALLAGWGLLGFIWFVKRHSVISKIDNPDEVGLSAFMENLPGLPAIFGKIFLPVNLYPLSNYEMFSIISGIVFMAVFTAFVLYYLKKSDSGIMLFGILWFLIFLVPTFFVRIAFVDDFFDYAEHRTYLPMIGLFIVIMEALRGAKTDFRKPLPLSIGVVIILAFAARSYFYIDTFQNRYTFWGGMTEMYPQKARGYLDLGKAYLSDGKYDKARELYRKGLERNPDNYNMHIDMAALNYIEGNIEKSESFARNAVRIKPDDALANYNLARALNHQEKFDEAIKYYEEANKRNTRFPDWYLEMGIAYYRIKEYEKAKEAYLKSLKLKPDNPTAYSNLGAAYLLSGDQNKAEKAWLKAIDLNPKMYDAYGNLVSYYLNSRQYKKALETAEAKVMNGGKLSPNNAAKINALKQQLQKNKINQ